MSGPGAPGPRRNPQIPLIVALFAGAFFAAGGLLVIAALLGMFPGKPLGPDAPVAVMWLIATVFLGAGIGIAVYQFLPRVAGTCAGIALLAFVATFNWVAFGPGERNFTKSSSVSSGGVGSAKKSKASEFEGRLVFGLVAGAFDALILYGLYSAARTRAKRRRENQPSIPRAAGGGERS